MNATPSNHQPDAAWLELLARPDLDWLDELTANTFTISEVLDEGVEQLDLFEFGEIYPSLKFHANRVAETDPVMAARLDEATMTFHDLKDSVCSDELHDLLAGVCHGLAETVKGRYISLYPEVETE